MNQSSPPFRVLFVCMGNICRSPAAEIIFRKIVHDAGREHDFAIDSAGTLGYHSGNPPDKRMAATLRGRGYSIAGSARQVKKQDLDRFDLIVTMDESNTAYVMDLATSREQRAKIRPLVGFCRIHDAQEVPDPYYGGQSGFDRVAELLEDGCAGILDEFPG